MPELPEVDSYRTGLDKMIKGWKLKGGRSIWQKACIDDFSIVKNQKVKGIVTERDILKKLIPNALNPKTTKLKQIMTSPVKVATKDDSLIAWLRQMSNERFRHVPVVDSNGKLINIMSQGDFVSYTWPNLLYQVKEIAKENYFKANQVVLIILSLLIYTIVTTVLAIKLV